MDTKQIPTCFAFLPGVRGGAGPLEEVKPRPPRLILEAVPSFPLPGNRLPFTRERS